MRRWLPYCAIPGSSTSDPGSATGDIIAWTGNLKVGCAAGSNTATTDADFRRPTCQGEVCDRTALRGDDEPSSLDLVLDHDPALHNELHPLKLCDVL
jgi:hypothetical protein